MTYRNVNRRRLAWLIGTGLLSDELRRFFKDRRAPLLLAGAKVQVAPSSFDESVNHISRFDDRASAVFAAWIKELKVDDAALFEGRVLPFVRAMETLDLRLPPDIVRKIARLGLKDLFSDSPDDAWLEFLSTEIKEEAASPKVESRPADSGDRPAPVEPKRITAQDIDVIAAWAANLGIAPNVSPSPWVEAIEVLEAIKSGSFEGAEKKQYDAEVLSALRAAHLRFKAAAVVEKSQGFSATEPELATFDSQKSYLSKDIVATYNSGGGPYFLDVLAFIDEQGAFALSEADLALALPEEGRLILHVDARLRAPVPGVAETYHAEKYPTSLPIKCRAVRHGRRLLDVTFVPHPSSSHDAVRRWIEESTHTDSAGRAPRIFVLTDGLCIRTRSEGRVAVGGATSDWTFDAWRSLKGIQLAGRAYVPEPLPVADGEYECQPPAVIARNYLRTLSATKGAKYTKQQLSDLSNYLADDQVAMGDVLRERLLRSARFLQSVDEHYDEIIQELLRSDAVAKDIERRKQEALLSTIDDLKAERDKLANLRRERQEIEASIKGLKLEATKRSKDVSSAVKKAFQYAAEHELETFGQLALLKTLTDIGPRPVESQPQAAPAALGVEFISASRLDASQVLQLLGYAPDRAGHIRKVLECAKIVGTPVLLEGVGANRIARKFAASVTSNQAALIEMVIGAYTHDAAKQAMEAAVDVVAFTSANLSCPTGYAQPVLARVVDGTIDPHVGAGALAIFSGVAGPMALPWPAELEAISLKISLDVETPNAESGRKDLLPVQRKLWARLEGVAEELQMSAVEIQHMKAMFGVIGEAGRSVN